MNLHFVRVPFGKNAYFAKAVRKFKLLIKYHNEIPLFSSFLAPKSEINFWAAFPYILIAFAHFSRAGTLFICTNGALAQICATFLDFRMDLLNGILFRPNSVRDIDKEFLPRYNSSRKFEKFINNFRNFLFVIIYTI